MNAVKEAVTVSAVKRPLSMEEVKNRSSMFAADRIRKGKTKVDRERGAGAKRAMNNDMRASWRNMGEKSRSHANFPWSACNGKKNRYQVTGKGGETVYLRDNKAKK
jgi:hypothetical protein